MHGNAGPERRGLPASNEDMFAGSLDVDRQDGQKKNNQAESREGAGLRRENSEGSKDFTDSGEVDQCHGAPKNRRHHERQVMAELIEVGGTGE